MRRFLTYTLLAGALFAPGPLAWAQPAAPSPVEQLYAELAKLPKEERQKRLEEGARKEGKLNLIHTWRGSLSGNHNKLFMKRYPFITVEGPDIGSPDAAERLVAENAAGRNLTDAVAISIADAREILEKQIAAVYPTPATDLIYEKYANFKDPQNRWVPFYWSEHGISYNPTMISAGKAPKDWFDLCDPEFRGQVSFDPFEVRFLAGLYQIMGEEKLKDWLKCIGENKPIIQRGHTQRVNLMIAGDHAAQGDNYLYHGLLQKKKIPSVSFEVAWGANMPATYSGVLINKNAQHPYAAALFADWTLSEESQKYTADEFRSPVAYKHPYMPDSAKITVYSNVGSDVEDQLFKYWTDYIVNNATQRKGD